MLRTNNDVGIIFKARKVTLIFTDVFQGQQQSGGQGGQGDKKDDKVTFYTNKNDQELINN